MFHYRRHSGFTVVELIVVITVIAILATIGIVSYSGYRQRADRSAAEASAVRIKSHLSEHFTDINYYPSNQAALTTYLGSVENSLATDLNSTIGGNPRYTYTAAVNSGGGACDNGATKCGYYTLTAKKEGWVGDSDVVYHP